MHSVKPQVLKFLLKLVEQNGTQTSSQIASLSDDCNLSRSSCGDWFPGHNQLHSAQHQSERKAFSPEADVVKMEVADDSDLNLAKLESEGLQIAKNGQYFFCCLNVKYRNCFKKQRIATEKLYYEDEFMKYSQDMKATWKIIKSLINSSQGTDAAEILKIDGK